MGAKELMGSEICAVRKIEGEFFASNLTACRLWLG
jgi:hypothetical protein